MVFFEDTIEAEVLNTHLTIFEVFRVVIRLETVYLLLEIIAKVMKTLRMLANAYSVYKGHPRIFLKSAKNYLLYNV